MLIINILCDVKFAKSKIRQKDRTPQLPVKAKMAFGRIKNLL